MSREIPKSSSSFFINLFGGICYVLSVQIAMFLNPDVDAFTLLITSVVAAIVPIIFCEIFILNVHKRERVGLIPKQKVNRERVALKLLGYYGSLGFVMLLYFIIPMYSDDEFYDASFLFLIPLLIVFMIGGWVYVGEFDSRLENPEDDLWHVGNFLIGRWSVADRKIVWKHLRSIILRAYYIPVMLTYFSIMIESLMKGQDAFITSYFADFTGATAYSFMLFKFMVMVYFYLAAMDVLFGLIGYLMALRVMDSNIKSTESTFFGWFVCLCCYYPFWELLFLKQFFIDFYTNPTWVTWFQDMPPFLVTLWGVMVVGCMALEGGTTLTFGIRFSNLTYRGLISEGPFRFTKHPQYIFKMFNRFLYFIPILSLNGVLGSIHSMLLFFGICFVYYFRARTEENHLSVYPEYVQYANWVNENGIFRFFGKYAPFLIFSEEKAKAGKIF